MTNAAWLPFLQGNTVGGYRLGAAIGQGNFSLVFEATNLQTGGLFAMKVLPPMGNPADEMDFDNEGVLLKKLNKCSEVVNVVESGRVNLTMSQPGGMPVPIPVKFHVLSLASGSLHDLVADPARLTQLAWPERIRLWRGAVKGVHQMHLKSVAHRDLKTGNCLLVVSGRRSEVRLADLGRARDLRQAAAHHVQEYLAGRGDLRHAPPEHLWLQGGAQAVDFRNADLYGLGSLLVELTTGHPITALAMGSWQDAVRLGQADLLAGVGRDLSVLRPQYRAAIEAAAEQMPPAIRREGIAVLTQLCDPIPNARPPTRIGRRYPIENGLLWLLARADIMYRRLVVADRRISYRNQAKNRSA